MVLEELADDEGGIPVVPDARVGYQLRGVVGMVTPGAQRRLPDDVDVYFGFRIGF